MRPILVLCAGLLIAGCTVFGPSKPETYNVFFRSGGVVLTPEAAAIVDAAASAIRQKNPGSVVIAAGSDTGDAMQRAQTRFAAVQARLVEKGVNPAVIARATLVEQPAELGPAVDRRVEIRLVNGAP